MGATGSVESPSLKIIKVGNTEASAEAAVTEGRRDAAISSLIFDNDLDSSSRRSVVGTPRFSAP